jgi:luciferase family oxidoreductase group 1
VALVLSALDQSPVGEGITGAQGLRNTVSLARLADRLGYHRYWVAEHHGMPAIASTSPEALIGPIAQTTTRIRVGSGGIMLPHYSPLKVAETFSILAALAPGTDPHTMFALQRDRRRGAPDDFPEQLAELIGYLDDTLPDDHPFRRLAALPGLPEKPDLWLLGTSQQSAIWAAENGLPYAFADFIHPTGASARWYRDHFTPSSHRDAPEVAVALSVICAKTDEEAEELALSHRAMLQLLFRGQLRRVPSVEDSRAILAGLGVDPTAPVPGRRSIVGSPSRVRAAIEDVAAQYGADEVLVVAITHAHADRCRSYELVAETFGLPAAPPASVPAAADHES